MTDKPRDTSQVSLTSIAPTGPQLAYVLDAIPTVIIQLDGQGGIEFVNAAGKNWFYQYTANHSSLIDLISYWENGPDRQREIMRVLRTGESIKGVRDTHYLDGQRRVILVDCLALKSNGCVNGALLLVNDQTDVELKEKSLKESEARYKAFIANSADAIWRYDFYPAIDVSLPKEIQVDLMLKRSKLVECNEKLALFFGYTSIEPLLGKPISKSGSLSSSDDMLLFVDRGYRLESHDFSVISHSGQQLSLQSSAIGIVEDGYLLRAWGTTRDITEQKLYLDHMEYLAKHDSLTSLPNRKLLYEYMSSEFARERPDEVKLLMLIDLDRFKEINDTLGHGVGDEVLKVLSGRLLAELGNMRGIVSRLGGDEFAVFLPQVSKQEDYSCFGQRFLDAIAQVFDLEGFRTEVSGSVGIAVFPEHADDIHTLMRFADVAMYHAKRELQGVALYSPEFDAHTPQRLEIAGALGLGLRENQLFLQYQPKINCLNGRITSFEALVRWRHPELGVVPPNEFIPIAEMSNTIHTLTQWVLDECARQCAEWREKGYEITMAMNLSARSLGHMLFVDELSEALAKYSLPGSALEIEITESMIMSDPEWALRMLAEINDLGVSLALDDFGTGYSSLAYLKRLPVQTLKIDAAFIQGMLDDEQDQIITNSTISLAHNLGLDVVAEGVETRDVYEYLQLLSCDMAQGYYFSRPLTNIDAERWMSQLPKDEQGFLIFKDPE